MLCPHIRTEPMSDNMHQIRILPRFPLVPKFHPSRILRIMASTMLQMQHLQMWQIRYQTEYNRLVYQACTCIGLREHYLRYFVKNKNQYLTRL